jgi:uncharacterized protein
MHIASPVHDRFATLDAIRGFAVLGILLTNIFIFALPVHALDLPEIWGEKVTANLLAWNFVIVFVDGVMRAMLAIVFGASAYVVLSRAQSGDAGRALGVLDIHFRRLLLLIAFGLIHAYVLLWPHDILFLYGLFGLFLFPFRTLSARHLSLIAGLMLLLSSWFGAEGASPIKDAMLDTQPALEKAEPSSIGSVPPLAGQLSESRLADDMSGEDGFDAPFAEAMGEILEEIEEVIAIRQSGYVTNFAATAGASFDEQTGEVFRHHFLDIFPVMLLGMALVKSGFLTSAWMTRRYLLIGLIGYVTGTTIGMVAYLPLSAPQSAHNAAIAMVDYGYELRRLGFAVGHICALIVCMRLQVLSFVTRRLCDCGRLALTLYIGQTVICLYLFYGFGFGLFGTMEHVDILVVALILIALQLLLAGPILRLIGQGPLERLLRHLSGSRKDRALTRHPRPL